MNRIIFLIVSSSLFAVAMGWLEGVVVVYLRTMLMRRPDWKTIEISREAATLIMLVTFALLAGWTAGIGVGLVNAWMKGLPPVVSAMGLSVYFGLIAGSAGVGIALLARSEKRTNLFLKCVCCPLRS